MPQIFYTEVEFNQVCHKVNGFISMLTCISRGLAHHFQDLLKNYGDGNTVCKEGYRYIPIYLNEVIPAFEKVLKGENPGNKKFLEIGCGIGMITSLVECCFGFNATGIDIVPEYIKLAKMVSRGTFVEADAFTFKNYDKFDVLYAYQPIIDGVAAEKLERIIENKMKIGAILIFCLKSNYDINRDDRFEKIGDDNIMWRKVKMTNSITQSKELKS